MCAFFTRITLALGLIALSAASAAAPVTRDIETVSVCRNTSAQARGRCPVVPLWTANPQEGIIWLSAPVRVGGEAGEPFGVFINAFAASAVYWDGQLIGRNGKPANSAALEVPGFRDAVIPIPSDLSRPGVHRLEIQMSTMRAPLRLAAPVLRVRVAPFEEALQPALRNYLPALLTGGGLLIVIICLAFLGWREGRIDAPSYAMAAALFATAQLGAESSRAFVSLLYPAQVVRLELVLLCSCGFGLNLGRYLLQRFEVGARRPILAAQTGLILLCAFAFQAFDAKVTWVILSSIGSCMAVCAWEVREMKRSAVFFGILAAGLFLSLAEPASFLDRDFYIWTLLLFVLILLEEVQQIGRAIVRDHASSPDLAPLLLGSGSTRHLVSPALIVRVAAADDYTEVFIADGPAVLHPEPLHKLLERLPAGFVRVHRSHAVNLAHLESFRRGPRSSVTLSDQSVAPVSRRCVSKLLAAISA